MGISESHTASAALSKNGQIIAAAAEERFTRRKLQAGFPKKAIEFCLKEAKISSQKINYVAVSDLHPPSINLKKTRPYKASYLFEQFLSIEEQVEKIFPSTQNFFFNAYKFYKTIGQKNAQEKRRNYIANSLKVPKSKIVFIPHHTSHMAAGLFSSPFPTQNRDAIVFTADGVGDFESGTIYIYSQSKIYKKQSISSQQSLGFVYQHITQYLGLKPVEDEYKVMGLSAYVSPKVNNFLKNHFSFDKKSLSWKIKTSEIHFFRKLPKILAFKRFDHIAFAAQDTIEKLLGTWVESNAQKFKIKNVVLGGGVFSNIKVNLKIAKKSNINALFCMPSPSDETNSIGAANYQYFIAENKTPKPLANLYLGPSFKKAIIEKELAKLKNVEIKHMSNNKYAATSLAKGEVIARFSGRMEFGQRALGNRSILARPDDVSIVSFINASIKNRDFWMPFAPTILREDAANYLVLHSADSKFMNVAYDTTEVGKKLLKAALHPFDKTTRPQILERSENHKYWDLIYEFKKITKIGALLNTSFNIHGEPIVCTPKEAIETFLKSGLKHLILEEWLISKK